MSQVINSSFSLSFWAVCSSRLKKQEWRKGKKDAKIDILCVPGTWTALLIHKQPPGGDIIPILQKKKVKLRVKCWSQE